MVRAKQSDQQMQQTFGKACPRASGNFFYHRNGPSEKGCLDRVVCGSRTERKEAIDKHHFLTEKRLDVSKRVLEVNEYEACGLLP